MIGPGNHRRWEISLKEGEDPRLAATPEQTWKLLVALAHAGGRRALAPGAATASMPWSPSAGATAACFVAGDAAHQQPPFLGQGMCQGVRDVGQPGVEAGSRAARRGPRRGRRALLDSYGEERKAHVRELTSRIKAIGAVICERDLGGARPRRAPARRMPAACVRDTPRQDVIPRLERGLLSMRGPSGDAARLFPQPWLLRRGAAPRLDDVAGTAGGCCSRPAPPTPASAAAPALAAHARPRRCAHARGRRRRRRLVPAPRCARRWCDPITTCTARSPTAPQPSAGSLSAASTTACTDRIPTKETRMLKRTFLGPRPRRPVRPGRSSPAPQAWPDKPVQAGALAAAGLGPRQRRPPAVGERLAPAWGQAVVIDNKPGGQNTIGAQAAARSPPMATPSTSPPRRRW